MNQLLADWKLVGNGIRWRTSPGDRAYRWHVAKRSDGWYWYTTYYQIGSRPHRTSSYVGPFTSWVAAAADCESVYRQEHRTD